MSSGAQIDGTAKRRGWVRLHRSTWVILFCAAVGLGLIIVPGDDSGAIWNSQYDWSPGAKINFEHGWPWIYLRRQTAMPANLPAGLSFHGVPPWRQSPAWSFTGDTTSPLVEATTWRWEAELGWWPAAIAADALVAAAILLLLAFGLECRHRRRRLWQFSLAELLLLTVLICCALGWWMANPDAATAQPQFAGSAGLVHHSEYRGPLWLRRAVGVVRARRFNRVVAVNTHGKGFRSILPVLPDRLPNIEIFEISSQDGLIDDDLRHLTRMTNLRSLRLQVATDSGLEHLRPLRRLRHLAIYVGSGVTSNGLEVLSEFKLLTSLSLGGFAIDGETTNPIGQLRRLERLALSHIEAGNDNLSPLAKLTNLRELNLTGAKVSTGGMVHLLRLTQLETLNLQETAVDDEGMLQLVNLKKLTQLDIRGTKVTPAGVAQFQKELPDCNVVWVPSAIIR